MMQSGDGAPHHYGHHAPTVPMDLHMPQPFSYYSCIMDNNAMFAAQQVQYNRMYGGLDAATGRSSDEIGAQSSINTRILELRKEKSRDAARSRRGKENHEFYELAKMLPLPNAITSQLDKASIIRLTIAYLKLREFAANGEPGWTKDTSQQQRLKTNALRSLCSQRVMEDFEKHEGTHILQSLDGFAISLNSDGRFLYISETVSIYLGLSQVEMTGSSFFDYVHQADHQELADQLGVTLAHQSSRSGSSASTASGADEVSVGASPSIPDVCYPVTSMMHAKVDRMTGKPTFDRAFCVRMKSTLTKRGCHFKSSGYRVVLLLGKLRPAHSTSKSKNPSQVMGFIGLAIALPPPSVHEVRLESDMFVTRLTFDFKIAHCEPKVSELLDYTAEELTGQSMYALCHGEDVHKLRRTHEDLLNKGQVMSNYFRLLNRTGGYSWMQSCATLICNTKNSDEQSIICVNYVLSGPQFSNVVMDQVQNPDNKLHVQSTLKDNLNKCEYSDSDTKIEKMSPSSVDLKHRSFPSSGGKEHLISDDPGPDAYHLPSNDDMRLGQQQQASAYHVTNTSNNKDWPFWRPPTLI